MIFFLDTMNYWHLFQALLRSLRGKGLGTRALAWNLDTEKPVLVSLAGLAVKSVSFFPATVAPSGVTTIARVSGFAPSRTFRVRGKVYLESTTTQPSGIETINFLPTIGNVGANLLFASGNGGFGTFSRDYIADPSVITIDVVVGGIAAIEFDFVYTNSVPVTSWSLGLSYNSAYVDGAVTAKGFVDVMPSIEI
jgi:hypothetical protein